MVAPTKAMAQKIRRELSTGRSDCGVLMSVHGYRTKVGQLKAYRNSILERYRPEQQKLIDLAELDTAICFVRLSSRSLSRM